MKKPRPSMKKVLIPAIVVSFFSLSLSVVTIAWFTGGAVKTDDVLDGEIGLRNYFYQGNGNPEYPYEIVSPIHFYNLTRLQNLGVFQDTKYFQIGHYISEEDGYMCLDGLKEDGSPNWVKYLDMEETGSVMPIGSEGTPFYGHFEGNDIAVKNLSVAGYPEDIGVFGYVAHEGTVKNLICSNLTVTSLGYNAEKTDKSNILYSQLIDNLFDENAAGFGSASLSFHNAAGNDYNLKKKSDPSLTENKVNLSSKLEPANEAQETSGDYTQYNGYFLPTFPTIENDPFSYSWRSSSSMLRKVQLDVDGDSELEEVMVLDMNLLKNSEDFNASDNLKPVDARISLIASVSVDSFSFSRVIQSYTLEFTSNGTSWEDGGYTLDIYCDYVRENPSDEIPNYHHGNNIGLLAGHVDGNLSHCYVRNGTFKFNYTGYQPIDTETDYGLIGEIGKNVQMAQEMDPEFGLTDKGDTGVMNFSRIYSLIRSDFNVGDAAFAGKMTDSGNTLHTFLSYGVEGGTSTGDHINPDTFYLYRDYLRHDEYTPYHYITAMKKNDGNDVDYKPKVGTGEAYTIPKDFPAAYNSVDFMYNNIIQDEEDVVRGLGVFKIVTSSNTKNSPTWRDNIGESRIINGSPKSKVYFSTAECDWNKGGGWSEATGNIYPLRMSTTPTYSNVNSFQYPFSRDYNYCYELDLAEENKPDGKNYMYNTDSPFLKNYLNSILINKYNRPITPGTSRFGFMFRSSQNEVLNSLSSYMPVSVPKTKVAFTTDEGTRYYPANSIVFHIDSTRANVSVVGNGSDIGIYHYNPDSPQQDLSEWYTMKSKNQGTHDMHRFFTYDYSVDGQGATSTVAEPQGSNMTDAGALYGHIFNLPQGDYVIGGSSESNQGGSANIYFLAVQGQTNAELGDTSALALGGGEIENVDFLLTDELNPKSENFMPAEFTFSANFNDLQGEMQMGSVVVDEVPYMKIDFNDGDSATSYLFAYCRSELKPIYYVNADIEPKRETYIYSST